MACKDCEKLKLMLDQALHERDEARQRAAEATDLLRSSEAREATPDQKKSKLLYLLTGVRR